MNPFDATAALAAHEKQATGRKVSPLGDEDPPLGRPPKSRAPMPRLGKPLRGQVLDVLLRASEPMTAQAVADLVGCEPSSASKALEVLQRDGKAIRARREGRFSFYSAAPKAAAVPMPAGEPAAPQPTAAGAALPARAGAALDDSRVLEILIAAGAITRRQVAAARELLGAA